MGAHTKTYDKRNSFDKGKRTFFMIPEVKQIIDKILRDNIRNIHQALFWDYQNNTFVTPTEINCYLSKLNKKHNISNKLTSHMLRHSFVTRAREKGMDSAILQNIVGHVESSKVTDQIYLDISQDFIKQELAKISF